MASGWTTISPAPVTLVVPAVGQGTQVVGVKGVDVAGNIQPQAVNYSWFVPLQCTIAAPGLPVAGAVGSVLFTRNTSLLFALGGPPATASFFVSVDGATAQRLEVSHLTVDVSGFALVEGTHNVTVWGVDSRGVVDSAVCAAATWRVDLTPPVSPSSVQCCGGDVFVFDQHAVLAQHPP